MRVEKRFGGDERLIVIGMILNRMVAAKIAMRWVEGGLFASSWANLVGGWCVDYVRRYDDAPGSNVLGLFRAWAAKNRDSDVVEIVEKFLRGLSEEAGRLKRELNPDYLLDIAGRHFDGVRLRRVIDEVQGNLDAGRLAEAWAEVGQASRLDLSSDSMVDLLQDQEALRSAFEDGNEVLFRYPGALGRFLGDVFERDSFIGIMAPEKRGKSWQLLDIAWWGLRHRRRVAFFEAGDMSQAQIIRRFAMRAAKRPMRATTLKVPRAIVFPPEGDPFVEFEEASYSRPMSWQEAWRGFERMQKVVRSKRSFLRLMAHPNDTLQVQGIFEQLREWERRDGWVPDLVVVDYADILAPPAGIKESRDQTNKIWKQLRSLSQQFHCCVVTATQADAASYSQTTLTRANFSEDKRKYSHVTAMIGISSTPWERSQGLRRIGWLAMRNETEFSEEQHVYVASCLGLANPSMLSAFKPRPEPEEEGDLEVRSSKRKKRT